MRRRLYGRAVQDLEDAANGADAPDHAADLGPVVGLQMGRFRYGNPSTDDLGHGPDTLLDDHLEDL